MGIYHRSHLRRWNADQIPNLHQVDNRQKIDFKEYLTDLGAC
ncbi:MAG: hypothetical protein CM1200mP9_06190 [Gammaproteobacteria bacterium]|nr:MAG: hypothetical protein CM1200mP9_06190 [Gammaproteobacteria bacterium]